MSCCCFFCRIHKHIHVQPKKKQTTHTQKKHKSSEAKVTRTHRRRESLIIYCLPCCLTPLTALRSLELTLSLSQHTRAHFVEDTHYLSDGGCRGSKRARRAKTDAQTPADIYILLQKRPRSLDTQIRGRVKKIIIIKILKVRSSS